MRSLLEKPAALRARLTRGAAGQPRLRATLALTAARASRGMAEDKDKAKDKALEVVQVRGGGHADPRTKTARMAQGARVVTSSILLDAPYGRDETLAMLI